MIIKFWVLFLLSVLISQSAMDLFSTLCSVAWVFNYWQAKQEGKPFQLFPRFGLESLWIIWILIVALGFLFHPLDLKYGLTRVVEFKWILILYVMVGIWLDLKPNRRHLNFLLGYMFFFSATNIAIFFGEFEFLKPLRYGLGELLRAGGFFGNPMTFAHSFVIFVCLLLGITLMEYKAMTSKQKSMALAAVILSCFGLLLTFTRGIWIGFTVSTLLIFLFWKPKYSVVLGLFLALLSVGSYRYLSVVQMRVDDTVREAQGHSERKNLWRANLLIIKENPLIGLGYGQNTMELPKYYDRLGITEGRMESHAHNQFLHLAAGTGLLGLLCYIAVWLFFYILLVRLWKLPNLESWDRGVVLGVLLGQTAFLIGGLTEANFEHSKVRFAVMIVWSYVVFLSFKYQQVLNWNWKREGK